jgi:hypothetical protein
VRKSGAWLHPVERLRSQTGEIGYSLQDGSLGLSRGFIGQTGGRARKGRDRKRGYVSNPSATAKERLLVGFSS